MDPDGLIFAVATTAEERAARRAGARTALIGLRAANGIPEGRLVSFGLAGALHDGLSCGEVIDATRVVDTEGAVLWEGPPLGVLGRACRDDPRDGRGRRRPRRAAASARAHRSGRGRHGERGARAHGPAGRCRPRDQRHARRAGSAASRARSAPRAAPTGAGWRSRSRARLAGSPVRRRTRAAR